MLYDANDLDSLFYDFLVYNRGGGILSVRHPARDVGRHVQ